MSQTYSVASNARRAAKKAGVNPKDIYVVPGGWKFDDPPEGSKPSIAVIETVAAELVGAPTSSGLPTVDVRKLAEGLAAPEPTMPETVVTHVAIYPTTRPGALARKPRAKAQPATKAAKPAPKAKRAAKAAKAPREKRLNGAGIGDQIIVALRQRWTPADELLKAYGWVSNTLRGFLSMYAKRNGVTIEHCRVDGAAQYRIAK